MKIELQIPIPKYPWEYIENPLMYTFDEIEK